MKTEFSSQLKDFAKKIVWYNCNEKNIQSEKDYMDFLVFLLGKKSKEHIDYARNILKIPDADFIEALHNAKSGVFLYEENWLACNKMFNINPPLPFPQRQWTS